MATPGDQDSASFVDTNIVLYSFDKDNPGRQKLADALITNLSATARLVVSTQVLNEVFWNLTRPHKPFQVSLADARRYVADFAQLARVVPLTLPICSHAFQVTEEHTLAFWDALVFSAAASAGCAIVYSEDMQHGRLLDGVRFVNPFL